MHQSINIYYILVTALAVVSSFFFHELAHFITGRLLGYKMGMTLNSAFLVEGRYTQEWHQQLINVAGPIFTIIQAFIAFYLIRKTNNKHLYPFLFFALYSRVLATVISINTPNDEARLSAWLGLGYWVIPLLVCCIILTLLLKISKEQRYNLKFNLINYLLVSVFITGVVYTDQYIITL